MSLFTVCLEHEINASLSNLNYFLNDCDLKILRNIVKILLDFVITQEKPYEWNEIRMKSNL